MPLSSSPRVYLHFAGNHWQTGRRAEPAMHVPKRNMTTLGKGAAVPAFALMVIVAAYGAAAAQGLTRSPAGAEVYFIDLKDGATVSPQLKLFFGLRNMGVAPAGSDLPNAGHHHLLVDT